MLREPLKLFCGLWGVPGARGHRCPAAPARLCQDRAASRGAGSAPPRSAAFCHRPRLRLVRLSAPIHATSEHPAVRRVWRKSGEPSGMGWGKRASPSPPSLPPSPLPPSPGDGVQVKSLDFNGGIRLKSLNSARPHCAGVGGGERSAGGMGGLPAGRGLPPPLLWERGETSNALTSSNRAPKGPAAFAH